MIEVQLSVAQTTIRNFVACLLHKCIIKKIKLSLVLCLAICIVGVYSDHVKISTKLAEKIKKDNPHIKGCVDESKVDEKILADMREHYKMPDIPELKCFLACMMKKGGAMNADGTFSNEFIGDSECKSKGGNGACEIAYNAAKCILEKDLASVKQNTK